MKTQVKKEHYSFHTYCDIRRFSSYWYQLLFVLKKSPQTVLEIGPGDHVFGNYITTNTSIVYTSVDFAADVKPDVVADVRKLPFSNNSFDVVCAFEVLEHLPFEEFTKTVSELLRVAQKTVVISLPYWGRSFSFQIQVPFFGKKSFVFRVPYQISAIPHIWDGEHYWEIGKKTYPIDRIRTHIINAGGIIEDEYTPPENTYHHFFVIRK